MSSELILPERHSQLCPLAEIADQATEFAQRSKARNTVRAYQADWADFSTWCLAHNQNPLPAAPETVALYVTQLAATHKTATITRRMSAVSQAHQVAGFDSPTRNATVRLVLAGIRRTKGTAQSAKSPILIEDLRRMV